MEKKLSSIKLVRLIIAIIIILFFGTKAFSAALTHMVVVINGDRPTSTLTLTRRRSWRMFVVSAMLRIFPVAGATVATGRTVVIWIAGIIPIFWMGEVYTVCWVLPVLQFDNSSNFVSKIDNFKILTFNPFVSRTTSYYCILSSGLFHNLIIDAFLFFQLDIITVK